MKRRGEQREEKKPGKESGGEGGSEKTRYLKLHGSVYYLSSAISASTEKVHPTEGSKDDLCAGRSRIRAIDQRGCAHRARSAEDRNLNFFLDRMADRYSSFFFNSLSGSRRIAESSDSRATTLRNDARVERKTHARCRICRERRRDRGVRKTPASCKNSVPFNKRNDLALRARLICFLTFSDIQLPRREVLRREPRRKNVINRSLACSLAAYRSAYPHPVRTCTHVDARVERKGRSLGMPIAASARSESRIQIDSSWRSMKTLERRGSCCSN